MLPKLPFAGGRASKVGRPPGEVTYVGEKKTAPVHLSVFDYDGQKLDERDLEQVEEAFPYRDAQTVSWINVDGVHDQDIIKQIGDHYNLHPLLQEDIANTRQRPKIEEFDDVLFVVAKMMYLGESGELHSEHVSLVIGPHYLLSFQEDPGDVFEPVRQRLRRHRGRIRGQDADYLGYALLDVIVDHYFVALEEIGEQIETLEDEVLTNPGPDVQQQINRLRRELITMRRTAWPLRELLSVLNRSESPLVHPDTQPFFRDVYDHAVQVIDIIESLRDVVSGLTDLFMTSLSNRMNEIMKFLTIVGTIFIPLTFIAGVYGMNFEVMPELHWPYAYPVALLAMATIGGGLILYFRRKGWV